MNHVLRDKHVTGRLFTLNEHGIFGGTTVCLPRPLTSCQSNLASGTVNVGKESGRVGMIGHDLLGRRGGLAAFIAQLTTHHVTVWIRPVVSTDRDPLLAMVNLQESRVPLDDFVTLGFEPQPNHVICNEVNREQ